MSSRSAASNPIASARPAIVSRTSTTFSGRLERSRRMFGGWAIPVRGSVQTEATPRVIRGQAVCNRKIQDAAPQALERLLGALREGAQLIERAAQESRDLHLRDTDTGGDLGLGEVLHESHPEDHPLTLRDALKHRRDRGV